MNNSAVSDRLIQANGLVETYQSKVDNLKELQSKDWNGTNFESLVYNEEQLACVQSQVYYLTQIESNNLSLDEFKKKYLEEKNRLEPLVKKQFEKLEKTPDDQSYDTKLVFNYEQNLKLLTIAKSNYNMALQVISLSKHDQKQE